MIIYNNCLLELIKLKDSSVDLILTDPPYNVGKDFGNESDKQEKEAYEAFILDWLKECYRVLKKNKKLIFTYSQVGMFLMKQLVDESAFNFVQLLIWNYGNIVGGFTGLYIRNYEPVFVLSKGKPEKLNRIKGVSTCDVLRYTKPQSNFKKDRLVHPTQKPYALWKRLVLENSKEGDIVVDTFAGCCQLEDIGKEVKRNTICYEINKEWREKYEYSNLDNVE